jgi:hypothetical protein
MFGQRSSFPESGPWNGIDGLSPQSQYQREVDQHPLATGLDISVIIDNIISAQSGILDTHTLCCNIQNAVNAEIEKIKEDIASVSKEKGPAGADGIDGKNGIDGENGVDGIDGKTPIKGVDYFDGKNAEPIEVKIIDEANGVISINGVEIKLPKGPRGPVGKAPLVRRPIAGMGGGLSGGSPGLKGDPGERGADGSGIAPLSAEVEGTAIQIGQPLYIKPTTKVSLAQADAGSTLAAGLAYSAAETGHSCQYLVNGQITMSNWTAVCGTTLLTPGARYFLSPDTAGMMTTVCPNSTGDTVQCLGIATSTENFTVDIQPSILL